MPGNGCSVCMPIMFVNSKFWGVKIGLCPYMVNFILTHIPVECRAVDPYVCNTYEIQGFLVFT